MADPRKVLADRFAAALAAAFGDELAGEDPLVRSSSVPKLGDYQSNVAMGLAKRLGLKPREIAERIAGAFEPGDVCEPPEIAGPGFLNVRLTDGFLAQTGASLLADPRLGVAESRAPETVVVDYSSPNAAKEMHVGHLRSSVIGDALVRTLEFRGHRVVRQNHIGDWGTQFGMLVEHLVGLGWTADATERRRVSDLNRLYQDARRLFEDDPVFQERSRLRVVDLQGGDEATLSLWRQHIAESMRHFGVVYERLGVTLEESDACPESFFNDRLAEVVRELTERGLLEESEGALCLFLGKLRGEADSDEPPMILRKKDGGFPYAATDMAAIAYRVRELGASRLLYVVGAPQELHFRMLFEAARLAGWLEGVRAEHVKFGSVLGEDGRPFQTRAGESVRLEDLLDEAEARAASILEEKNPELPAKEKAEIARLVGTGSIKYADLSSERGKNYVFSWERMLSFDGNTAPYLQNAYVRIRSIFRRAGIDPATLDSGSLSASDPAERDLLLTMLRYPTVVTQVEESLEPHRLCTFLFELATIFHRFYEACPVLKAETGELRDSRLRLSRLTSRILEQGLGLLGIGVPERM